MNEIDLAKKSVGWLYRVAEGSYSDDERYAADELRAELHTAYGCEIDGCGRCREFWADECADMASELKRCR